MTETKKLVLSSSLSAIVATILVLGSASYLDKDTFSLEDYLNSDGEIYKCIERDMTWPCQNLSKYYGIPNGKCLNLELGNKLCRSGWEKINIELPTPIIQGRKWNCSAPPKYGCEEIK